MTNVTVQAMKHLQDKLCTGLFGVVSCVGGEGFLVGTFSISCFFYSLVVFATHSVHERVHRKRVRKLKHLHSTPQVNVVGRYDYEPYESHSIATEARRTL